MFTLWGVGVGHAGCLQWLGPEGWGSLQTSSLSPLEELRSGAQSSPSPMTKQRMSIGLGGIAVTPSAFCEAPRVTVGHCMSVNTLCSHAVLTQELVLLILGKHYCLLPVMDYDDSVHTYSTYLQLELNI